MKSAVKRKGEFYRLRHKYPDAETPPWSPNLVQFYTSLQGPRPHKRLLKHVEVDGVLIPIYECESLAAAVTRAGLSMEGEQT
jgi:hypothetical protein